MADEKLRFDLNAALDDLIEPLTGEELENAKRAEKGLRNFINLVVELLPLLDTVLTSIGPASSGEPAWITQLRELMSKREELYKPAGEPIKPPPPPPAPPAPPAVPPSQPPVKPG